MDFSKHNQGTTSVKVHHAPGGKSNFSLAWGDAEPTNQQPKTQFQKKEQTEITSKPNQAPVNNAPVKVEQQAAGKSSVKVNNPPGGKSSITFGWLINDHHSFF